MDIYNELAHICGSEYVLCNESMKLHTSFKIGGPADYLVTVCDTAALSNLVQFAAEASISYIVVGRGTNLLVSDDGYRGIVLKLGGEFTKLQLLDSQTICAGGGVSLSALASFACEHALSGLEFASGIPGSVGGGIYMNAGAYGGEIADVLISSTYFELKSGLILQKEQLEHQFSYRHSSYADGDDIILSGRFCLRKSDSLSISGKMRKLNALRRDKQPLDMPSAGSAFKRPQGAYAAELIERCGLKGFRHNDVQVSTKHSGFIVNLGNATCKDVLFVLEYIRQMVYMQSGVELVPEIKYIKND